MDLIEGKGPAGIAPEHILASIVETARECVIVVDLAMRIRAANRPAHIAFARGDESLEGRRLSEVIRDPSLHDAFQRAIRRGAAVELKLEIGPIKKRIYDIHIAPLDLGSPYGVGFFYDSTRVERLERVRQEFLSNISHELRTPLSSILAFVETLEDGAINDKENSGRFLGVIRRNAERMRALIDDILELSMIESGNVSIHKVHLNLASLVDGIFDSLSSKAAEREITLEHDLPPEATVHADAGRLEQMLTNLIDNAIKFNRQGGSVRVGLSVSSERPAITVSDTGEGILPENLGRIFERFYRLDRGRTREVGGTGLGLAIVKHLAKLHGGTVSVRSELARGTEFTVELPAA